ncbi:hypothetical protein D0T60_15610 [Bacteroides sp. 224]|nr:hypothetical protein [Bacteroides sp. 224]
MLLISENKIETAKSTVPMIRIFPKIILHNVIQNCFLICKFKRNSWNMLEAKINKKNKYQLDNIIRRIFLAISCQKSFYIDNQTDIIS